MVILPIWWPSTPIVISSSSSRGPLSIMRSPIIMRITITLIRISSSRYCSSPSNRFLFRSSPNTNRSRTIQLRYYICSMYSYKGASIDVSFMRRNTTMGSGHLYISTVTTQDVYSGYFSLRSQLNFGCIGFSIN